MESTVLGLTRNAFLDWDFRGNKTQSSDIHFWTPVKIFPLNGGLEMVAEERDRYSVVKHHFWATVEVLP
jgi:hypothetical protein